MMALYYKKDRFALLAEGHFWLSETPETPGSKSWDSSLPRMVTWVKLQDRQQPSSKPILFLNTHFDHRGPQPAGRARNCGCRTSRSATNNDYIERNARQCHKVARWRPSPVAT